MSAANRVCKFQTPGGPRHRGHISRGLLCHDCRLKVARAAGARSSGNRVCGLAKRAAGMQGSGNRTQGRAKVVAGKKGAGNHVTGGDKIAAGRLGGIAGRGSAKQRRDAHNGWTRMRLNNPRTWRPISVTFDVFKDWEMGQLGGHCWGGLFVTIH